MKKSSSWFALLALLAPLASPAAESNDVCGGVRLANGRVETGKPLVPGSADSDACLKRVADELRTRPDIRSITVAARLPDKERLDGKGLEKAKAAADVLVAAGLPRTRVSAVAPPLDSGAPAHLRIAYVERPSRRPVARLRTAQDVAAGADAAELKPQAAGDVLYAQDLVRNGPNWTELELADGSVLRLAPQSLLRLGTVGLNANGQRQVEIEVIQGTVEADAKPAGQGAVFEMKTRTAVAGVRGTSFRTTVVDEQGSRLETLEGHVALGAGKGDTLVDGGYGSRVKGGEAAEAPRMLLTAPDIGTPRFGTFPASPRLTWKGVSGAKAYRVEVARTADFDRELHRYSAASPELALEPLPGGHWFWRVTPIDADGFEGYSSKIYAFDLIKKP